MLTTDRPTIPIAKPELGEEEAAAAREAILSGWVTQGPRVAAFEEAFAHHVGARHACAVSNCTTALHLALHALGVGPGDEVVTVSHSFIATGDGGMLTTSDPDLDAKFRLLRQHAMSIPDTVRHGAKSVIFEEYPAVGFNYRMTDIQGAVGAVQLRRLPGIFARRVELAERYTRALADIPGLLPPHVPDYARPNYQGYPVRVTSDYPLTRNELMQVLLDR